MAKKKNKAIRIGTITKEQRFEAEKPRYNAYQGGYGAFKSKKAYSRKDKHKQKLF